MQLKPSLSALQAKARIQAFGMCRLNSRARLTSVLSPIYNSFVRFREYANPILMVRFSKVWRPVICLVAYTNDASNPISDQGGWPLRWTSTLGPEWPREHHLSPSAHRVRITRIPTSVRTTKPQLHVLLRDYAENVNQT